MSLGLAELVLVVNRSMAVEEPAEVVPGLFYFGNKLLVGGVPAGHPMGEVTVGCPLMPANSRSCLLATWAGESSG